MMHNQSGAFELRCRRYVTVNDVTFWQRLSTLKLDEFHLSEVRVPILGSTHNGRHVSQPGSISLTAASFAASSAGPSAASADVASASASHHSPMYGQLLNYNTINQFKSMDTKSIAAGEAQAMVDDIRVHIALHQSRSSSSSARSASSITRILSRFLLLTFADLKLHKFAYWMLNHALVIEGLGLRNIASSNGESPASDLPPSAVSARLSDNQQRQLLIEYARFARENKVADCAIEIHEHDDQSLPSSSSSSTAPSSVDNRPSEMYFVVEVDSSSDSLRILPLDIALDGDAQFVQALYARPSTPSASSSSSSSFSDAPAASVRRFLAFVDPCPLPSNLGWPARNLVSYAFLRAGLGGAMDLLAFRDVDESFRYEQTLQRASHAGAGANEEMQDASSSAPASASLPPLPRLASLLFPLDLLISSTLTPASILSPSTSSSNPSTSSGSKVSVVGFERNALGKVCPRSVDLGSTMDPLALAARSVNLNLQLMRWRALPSLDLELLGRTKVLLVGAGTLGCNVARALLGWGVRNVTFVDNGRVAFSNPVRQSLFNYEDCISSSGESGAGGSGGSSGAGAGGRMKAPAAAAALKRIHPSVNAVGHVLSIPMPGHVVSPAELPGFRTSLANLEDLIREHDAIFLLTDSRESRWLPTMVAAAQTGKIVINTALGFDSYVVMRHGDNYGGGRDEARRNGRVVKAGDASSPAAAASAPAPASASSSSMLNNRAAPLGCYFCNDVVAPTDSLTDRTLDQQCTVTRPGLSFISSALAVELFVATLHHPLRQHAYADLAVGTQSSSSSSSSSPALPSYDTGFGLLPHQVRGVLSQYSTHIVIGQQFHQCTACNDDVIRAYTSRGAEFVLDAINKPSLLEHMSGLEKLKRDTEAMLNDMDDIDDEDETM